MDQVMEQQNEDRSQRLGGIARRHQREQIQGFHCDIADDKMVFAGVVEDVSASGFRMSQIPQGFAANKHNYTAVFSGNGNYFKILIKPCWKRKDDDTFEIGFKVIDAPWEWHEFVLLRVSGQLFANDWAGSA